MRRNAAHPPARAETTFGLFTRADAVAAGYSAAQVRRRVRCGEWVVVVGEVMTVPGLRDVDPWLRSQAAALHWPDGVVCLRTAALLHRIPLADDGLVHVLVPIARASGRGMVTHQWPLEPGDVTQVALASATDRRRTVLDCLGRLPDAEVDSLVAWVSSRRLLTADEIDEWLTRHPYSWGNARRRRVLDRLRTGTGSEAEARLHQLLRRAHIGGWIAGAHLLGEVGVAAQADVWFPAERLVVEVDGVVAHGPARFQADRAWQNALVRAGCTVLRFTWRDLVNSPAEVIATILATLAGLRRQVCA